MDLVCMGYHMMNKSDKTQKGAALFLLTFLLGFAQTHQGE